MFMLNYAPINEQFICIVPRDILNSTTFLGEVGFDYKIPLRQTSIVIPKGLPIFTRQSLTKIVDT